MLLGGGRDGLKSPVLMAQCGLTFLPMPKEEGLGYHFAQKEKVREKGEEGLEAINSQI